MLIELKLTPPVLLFSDFAYWAVVSASDIQLINAGLPRLPKMSGKSGKGLELAYLSGKSLELTFCLLHKLHYFGQKSLDKSLEF